MSMNEDGRHDFGPREVFFLLVVGALAVGLSWLVVHVYTDMVRVVSSFVSMLGFGVWLMFQ